MKGREKKTTNPAHECADIHVSLNNLSLDRCAMCDDEEMWAVVINRLVTSRANQTERTTENKKF